MPVDVCPVVVSLEDVLIAQQASLANRSLLSCCVCEHSVGLFRLHLSEVKVRCESVLQYIRLSDVMSSE